MTSRIAQCQKRLDDLKQKFDRRVNIDTNRQLKCIKDDQLGDSELEYRLLYNFHSCPHRSQNNFRMAFRTRYFQELQRSAREVSEGYLLLVPRRGALPGTAGKG
jgi:hypothetical protein